MANISAAEPIAVGVNGGNATITPLDYASDPAIESHTKTFLKALNSGDGPPLETLPPPQARAVLEGAQSMDVDLSGIDITEKNITQDGLSVKLYIVRPAGETAVLPVF